MPKLLFFSLAAVWFGWVYVYLINSKYIPRITAAFGTGLPVSRWSSCSVKEKHRGDWSFQAAVTHYPAVPVAVAAQKCPLCPCSPSPLDTSDCGLFVLVWFLVVCGWLFFFSVSLSSLSNYYFTLTKQMLFVHLFLMVFHFFSDLAAPGSMEVFCF